MVLKFQGLLTCEAQLRTHSSDWLSLTLAASLMLLATYGTAGHSTTMQVTCCDSTSRSCSALYLAAPGSVQHIAYVHKGNSTLGMLSMPVKRPPVAHHATMQLMPLTSCRLSATAGESRGCTAALVAAGNRLPSCPGNSCRNLSQCGSTQWVHKNHFCHGYVNMGQTATMAANAEASC